MTDDLPAHVLANREAWNRFAPDYAEPGRRAWEADEPRWGIWGIPESQLHLLPDDLAGKATIELGCGTAYVSAWLARRGAHPVGIDNSPAQLETARALQQEFGISFPLHLGNAERLPFEDGTFDYAVSEYGAALWADPYRWVPEAARVLRPGGELLLYTNGWLLVLTTPEDEYAPSTAELRRPAFGPPSITWQDDGSTEFHLRHGEWIRLLRECGFEVERLVEVQAPEGAANDPRWTYVSPEWARQWPSEEAWIARKRA